MTRILPRLLLLAGLLVAGCASASRLFGGSLPPIASGGPRLPGKIVWRDLVTADMAGAQRFYAGVFGWQFEPVADGYVLARNGDRLVGGIAALGAADGSQWLTQIAVADAAAAAAAARGAGATILLGPLELRGRGRVVVARDPLGAVFGMLQASDGDPADLPPRTGDWLWSELWVDDPPAAAKFYFPLFNYAPGLQRIGDKKYLYFKSDGRARGGLVQKPDPQVGNAWVSYVKVADVDAAVARALQFGGRVLFAPSPDVRGGSVAVLADPGGAGLLVQEWPVEGAS